VTKLTNHRFGLR